MKKTVANQVKNPRRSARSVEIPSLASGWQTFKYGKLGEVIENIRTFALPFENQPYTFKMQYEYDSYNRIQKMTYPDGEEVHYEYNLGGMLEKMSGNKNGVQYTYIDSIAYNEFELKEAVFYGNGTRAYYNYDVLQRLKHLFSECADGVMQDLYYDYDTVSNITSIGNHAGMLSNGLGGNYSNRYRYDNLYRLVHSDGEWNGDRYLHYDMNISYSKNGRLKNKSLASETWLDGNLTPIHYDNNYSYDENHQPNTVRGIDGSHHHEMQWDVKGNLVRHRNHHAGYDRRLCWDEQNRLRGVVDERYLSLYQYDANGDRTYKLTGMFDRQNVSGMWWHFYQLNNATLYASPYVVATRYGYTKHYYAENERVASKIGGGGLHGLTMTGNGIQDLLHPELPLHHPSCIPTEDEFIKKNNVVTQHAGETARCLESEIRAYAPLESFAAFSDILNEEPDCYWYHTDNLGSSSWITYTDGHAVQHLHYLPFGENFVDQKSSSFDGVRYTFSAKEKDTETGYSYFGARYYSSELSIWLSVDPMASKYPHQSNYVYCSNNPIRIIDPNGEDEWEVDKKGNITWKCESEKHQLFALDKNGKRTGESITLKNKDILNQLEKGKRTVLKGYDGNVSEEGNRREAIVGKKDVDDLLNVFKFVSDNSNVEWEFEYSKQDGKSQYSLVTDGFSNQVRSHFGSKAITSIHSHPNEPNNYQSELNSLYGDRGYLGSYPKTNMYVYMPKSTRLFNVNKNAYIRHINNDYRRFINLGR